MQAKLRYALWTFIMIPAIVPLFLGKDPFITNFNGDGTARTSFPPFAIPLFMAALIFAIELFRRRRRSYDVMFADLLANGILLLIGAGMIFLDVMNAKPELFFS